MATTAELTAAVTKQTASIERLVDSVDSVERRLTTVEVQVEERTGRMASEDTVRMIVAEHTAACSGKKIDRAALRNGKVSSWPPKSSRMSGKARVFGGAGAGAGLAGVGYGLWHLFEWILSH